jgi:hypothetical protein
LSDVPARTGAFELSRAYGEGWKAAKELLASAKGDMDPNELAARNPHCTPEKRARWMQGFAEAVGSPTPTIRKWGGNAWRSRTR